MTQGAVVLLHNAWRVPARLETERLVIRAWQVGDAPRLKAAIDENLAHLQAWMPWAMVEPSPLSVIEARLATFRAEYESGTSWASGLWSADESRLLGGIGLHRTEASNVLELGYWIRADESGKGFVAEAVIAWTGMALALPGIERVEIHCDPRNARSIAVARRAGYRYRAILRGESITPTGEPRDTAVWERGATASSPEGG